MRKAFAALTGIVAILLVPVIHAGAQTLAIYDDFNTGSSIDPLRWRGFEQATTNGVINTEATRRIVADELQIALTTHGGTGSDTGSTGDGRNRLLINHPVLVDGTPRITVLQATVRVNRATVEDCSASDTATRARAQLLAFFFNDGTGNVTPGDLTGDILAGVQLQRDSRADDTIVAFLSRCTNANCASASVLKFAVFTRTWTAGVAEVLTVKWQPANNRFLLTARSGPNTETQILTYDDIPLSDGASPKGFVKDLRVANTVANCSTGSVGATIDARFDNVRINAAAVNAFP